jgi:predicted DsbA family dithiol-disulfide isomerase
MENNTTTTESKKVKIDIVSDIACPWCYIGKKRLETSIWKNNANVEIRFLPFQLDPTIPENGVDRKYYFENKFGSEERVEAVLNRVEGVGESLGIQFQFRSIPIIPNTLKLHMLLSKAVEEGFQLELAATLFDRYMVNPIDLSKDVNLCILMSQYGWQEAKTKSVLANDVLRKQVVQQIQQIQQLGIRGVPFFIINNQYSVSGAQAEDVWDELFQSLSSSSAEGDACNVNGNDC